MVSGIEACLVLKSRPDAVLALTDGYTPYPDHVYPVPVLYGIWSAGDKTDVLNPPMPPWQERDVVVVPLS